MSGFEEDFSPAEITYEPVNVKDILVEMKDTAEVLIDLAYSAVLYQNEALAREVIRLEHEMDILDMRARMGLMMAARSPDDAEALAPVMSIVTATETISNAAGDIVSIVLEEIGLPEAMRAALPEAIETLVEGVVTAESSFVGRTLEDIDLESTTGVRVIALRRGDDWLLNPGPTTTIEADDIAFLRGPDAAISAVHESLTGHPYDPPLHDAPDLLDLDRAVTMIIHMKNLSELAVDLAYSSVLFNSEGLAEEVKNLEIEVDAMQSRFEAWTLQAAAEAPDPVALRGLIRIGTATEVISDAAVDIIEGVVRTGGVHPVVQLAVEESDEIIMRYEVQPGSQLDGIHVTEGVPDVEPTMTVIAVRRPDEGWLLGGDSDNELQAGDVLITKGTRTAAEAFESLSGNGSSP